MGRERVGRDVLNWIEVGKSGQRQAEVGFGQKWGELVRGGHGAGLGRQR
jgi:hypothetical protein